jgi:hypothetical protein
LPAVIQTSPPDLWIHIPLTISQNIPKPNNLQYI